MSSTALISAINTLTAIKETGISRLSFAERVDLFTQVLAQGQIADMSKALPVMLNWEGQPYTLEDHAPFEAMFRLDMPQQLVFMTGRQVSKSTSIASHGVITSIAIPNFKTLFVTPLFEQIRRLSTQYVGPFINNSPVKSLWINTESRNNVLSREFANGSRMTFSHAFLDVERIRGVAADVVAIDECFTSVHLVTIYENGRIQTRKIVDLKPGDFVASFNENGELLTSVVNKLSYHGRRGCFRITTQGGKYVEATSESWMATDQGWRRVSQIIEAFTQSKDGESQTSEKQNAQETEQAAKATTAGNNSGRRFTDDVSEKRSVRQQSWLGTERIQLDKVHDIIRVYSRASQKTEERRLRRLCESVPYALASGVYLLAEPSLQNWHETSPSGTTRSDRQSGLLAMSGVVDRRRRLEAGDAAQPEYEFQHTRLSETGCSTTSKVASTARTGRESLSSQAPQTEEDLLDYQIECGKHALPDGASSPAHVPSDAIQSETARPRRDTDLPLVPGRIPTTSQSKCGSEQPTGETLLPENKMPTEKASRKPHQVRKQAGNTSKDTCQKPQAVLLGHREESGTVKTFCSGIHPQAFGQDQSGQTQASYQKTGSTSSRVVDLPTVSTDGTTGHPTQQPDVLQGLPRYCDKGNQGTLVRAKPETVEGSEAWQLQNMQYAVHTDGQLSVSMRIPGVSEQAPLRTEPDEIVSIEYIGEHDVYDIEVEGTHTFFANGIAVSNCQDMNREFIPIIDETMSHSAWTIRQMTGTPKTEENTLTNLFRESSQCEWFVPCMHCTEGGNPTWNIPSREFHIEKMIGPWHENISEQQPATICHKCGKPISPRMGRWVPREQERHPYYAGYHVPQIIMPLHFADPVKWKRLVDKRAGKFGTAPYQFWNEVLGTPYDTASKLVTMTELRAACMADRKNTIQAAQSKKGYRMTCLTADWGGGGKDETSFTTLSYMGIRPDGKIEVLWGKRLMTPHAHLKEARQVLEYWNLLRPDFFVHDYTGSGTLRETFIVQAGVPAIKILPMAFIHAAKGAPVYHVAPTPQHPRHHYRVDRPRLLLNACAAIKLGVMDFFEWDWENQESPGLISDFLALIEEKTTTMAAGERYLIRKQDGLRDDFACAVSMGATAFWYVTKAWPDFSRAAGDMFDKEWLDDTDIDGDWDANDFD
jgi:hypothetical protein